MNSQNITLKAKKVIELPKNLDEFDVMFIGRKMIITDLLVNHIMCVLLITRLLGLVGRLESRKPV